MGLDTCFLVIHKKPYLFFSCWQQREINTIVHWVRQYILSFRFHPLQLLQLNERYEAFVYLESVLLEEMLVLDEVAVIVVVWMMLIVQAVMLKVE